MAIAYLDCFAGISGDMFLGALLDAGLPLTTLVRELRKLPLRGYRLSATKLKRCGIAATKVEVTLTQREHGRQWTDIVAIIKASKLEDSLKQQGRCIFRRLFEAEAAVHGKSFRRVHLHELGATDCFVDIFGTIIGLRELGIETLYTSPINLGSGTVGSSHGILPVPAPATIELLKGLPVYSANAEFELTTPTGAALVAGLDAKPASLPHVMTERVGYGAGSRDPAAFPNVLRIIVGDESVSTPVDLDGGVVVIETNIDDMSPQLYEDVFEKLFAAGALDVFLENISMKKGRPAVKLTVIGDSVRIDELSGIIFTHTSTIGLRYHAVRRKTLQRQVKTVSTRYGPIRIKYAFLDGRMVNSSPEYEDLKTLSRNAGISIKELLGRIT